MDDKKFLKLNLNKTQLLVCGKKKIIKRTPNKHM